MLLSVKTRAIAALTALSLVASLPTSPALAFDKNERNFIGGVATAVVVGAIINDINQKQRGRSAPPQYVYQPRPTYQPEPYYQPRPVYQPQPVYQREPIYQREPVYQPQPVYRPGPSYGSIYATPAARAFQSYSSAERKAIQRRLATQGYYRSGIDGSFGPGTYSAVVAYAQDTRMAESLQSTAGSYSVYDGLLF